MIENKNIYAKFIIISIFLYPQIKTILTKQHLLIQNNIVRNKTYIYNDIAGKKIYYKNINFINSSNVVDSYLYIYFNVSFVNYHFSYKFNKVEVEYSFLFFDKENNIIIPSDLSLYYSLHAFCILNNGNNSIQSISNIYQNKYFSCLEYYELNIYSKFEIKICNDSFNCSYFYLFDSNIFDYNNIKFLRDEKFDFNYINKKFSSLSLKINKTKEGYLLKKSYILQPVCSTKEKAINLKNIWYLKNIYNHYFCFCNGNNCTEDKNFDTCKYYLYLSIIDDNQYLYKKTNYLFYDFIFANRAPGDAFFVFRKMARQNMSVFYLTERKDIYRKYFSGTTKFQRIIPIINKDYQISGNFLERYLYFFLKLKCVISGSGINSKENIFFIIPYITFICLGHGVNYFKKFLYNDYYGSNRYHKILLASDKIVSIAKRYGWKEKNIIKIGLPKWDLFRKHLIVNKKKIHKKCIFTMFTWRNFKKGKYLSPNYFNNIQKLLNHSRLEQLLLDNNITLYISLHHNLLNKRNKIKKSKNSKYIKQEDIINCLYKCDLLISDFSSVIFDFMYRKKPIIIFVPDSDDKNLNELYDDDYLNIINGLKNNTIKFENKFFNLTEAIKKIEYYALNNFQLDRKLKILYAKFNLNSNNNINKFIKYLKTLD